MMERLNERHVTSAINKSLICLLAIHSRAEFDVRRRHNLESSLCLEIEAHIFDRHDRRDTFTFKMHHVRWKAENNGGENADIVGICLFFVGCDLLHLQTRQSNEGKSDFMLTSSLKRLKSAKFGCCTLFCGVFSETLIK